MKLKTLEPITMKDAWSAGLERKFRRLFEQAIYKPLIDALDAEKHNAVNQTVLLRALADGTVIYKGGWFRGHFNAAISKELKDLGAKWDRVRKAWFIAGAKMPPLLFLAASRSEQKHSRLFAGLLDVASDTSKRVMEYLEGESFDPEDDAEDIMERVDEAFHRTVSKEIAVQPIIHTVMRKIISKDLTKTTTKPIRKVTVAEATALRDKFGADCRVYATNFADEEVERLREELEERIKRGDNRKDLRDYIMGRLGVAKNRARFIARQESKLLTSKLSETQYRRTGIATYIWMANPDSRTRDLHRAHHGRQYRWGEAIIDERTGERGNPGEAFGCRCVARPVVEGFKKPDVKRYVEDVPDDLKKFVKGE